MAIPDFYKILDVSPSASADEIKAAHRELVKKYHPDLFPTGAQKAQANDKLQQINEAYAVLSNRERRREYDSGLLQEARPVKRAAATKSRSTATPRRPPAATTRTNLAGRAGKDSPQMTRVYRNLLKAARNSYTGISQKLRTGRRVTQGTSTSGESRSAGFRDWNLARRWTRRVSVRMMLTILGIVVLVLILQAVWKEPEITTAWTLWENTVLESPQTNSGLKSSERNWSALGDHGSKAQCAESLKQRVAMDEQGGSNVFLDERTGTIAMTIYGKTEAVLAEEFLREKLKQGDAAGVEPQTAGVDELEKQARKEAQEFVRRRGFTQRVKHYQCRETQVIKSGSWLRGKLRQLGLIS
jgi:hypothetical protein